MSVPPQFTLYDSGQKVIMWADGLADLLPYFLVGDMLGVRNTHESPVASQLHAQYSLL